MNSERLWILILTLAAFSAGLAAGVLFGRETATAQPARPFAPYLQRLVDEFELNASQERDLGIALAEYDEQIQRMRDHSLGSMQPELIKAGEDCYFKIRDFIIPIDRRPEFDRLLVGPVGALPPERPKIQ